MDPACTCGSKILVLTLYNFEIAILLNIVNNFCIYIFVFILFIVGSCRNFRVGDYSQDFVSKLRF